MNKVKMSKNYVDDGKSRSLAIDNCVYNPNWYCARDPFLCTSVGPNTAGRPEVTVLNPELYAENVDTSYFPVKKTVCGNPGFTSDDARLKNPRTGNIPLELDKRPMNMGVSGLVGDDVYTKNCDSWKTGYTRYEDMKKGQITYYVDQEISGPFPHPNFDNKAAVSGHLTVTPMNKLKPIYTRTPLKKRDCLNTELCRCDYTGGLSWIEDSQEHREDMMSKQLWRTNSSKWESRWKT